MPVNVILGLQRGDEGKGRFVDMLAHEHDIVARFNGGNNAGHTVVLPDERELALHLVPSGIAHDHAMNVIGNGTLVNPVKLLDEIEDISSKDIEVSERNLKVSSYAHLILPHHISEDEIREAGERQQGSTKSGIAQVSSDKSLRIGARAEIITHDPQGLLTMVYAGLRSQREIRASLDLPQINECEVAEEYVAAAQKIGSYIADTVLFMNEALQDGKRVLAEGAQAFLLDIDHGMYPYTTSSSTTAGGVCTGLGVAPTYIESITGIAKGVQSHVGGGPFVTEIHDQDTLQRLHGDMSTVDAEKGTTTGRVRRLGYLDIPQIKRAQMINGGSGAQDMALSKLDWVQRFGDDIPVCVAYDLNGETKTIAPGASYELEQARPIYELLPAWSEDIQGVRDFKDLPSNAQQYVTFVEEQTGVPISMIGVGPNRDQVIVR